MPRLSRVADMVRSILPGLRYTLTPQEVALADQLRGNAPLYESLVAFVTARIGTRAAQPVPADPIDCRASMERDHELRILLNRLEFLYKSPVAPTQQEGEPPA
jgi:hypothetical protein